MKNITFKFLLSTLKKASLNNQKFIILPRILIKQLEIIKILHQAGFIQSFENSGNYLIIRLKQVYQKTWDNPQKSLLCISSALQAKRQTISYKKLIKLEFLVGSATTIITSTDKGLIKNAQPYKIGGIPLFKIM